LPGRVRTGRPALTWCKKGRYGPRGTRRQAIRAWSTSTLQRAWWS
jgi:hypothetical protein